MTSHALSAPASTETLPRSHRITRRKDFVRAYETGRKTNTRYAVIFAVPNLLGHSRVGITTTKKLGKAHSRNRMKRWVREVYRRERTTLELDATSLDFVVNVKRNAVESTFADFRVDLCKGFNRAARSVESPDPSRQGP